MNSIITFPPNFRSLVIGANGALGSAFVTYLRHRMGCQDVVCVSRSNGSEFDLENPHSIEALGKKLAGGELFHIIIDATGALTIGDKGPEKSLAKLDSESLSRSFAINAIGPALLLRYLSPLLVKGDSIYAKLSARVGSIADNQKGGWYGYRASKAAMNMILQTASIELHRSHPKLRVIALQPGTVRSKLSQPFLSGVPSPLEPVDSVEGMMSAMLALEPQAGAYFMDYKGQKIPW